MSKKFFLLMNIAILAMLLTAGCASREGNEGQMSIIPVPSSEAKWIKEGEPIEFEGDKWYPQDVVDILLDSEVEQMGEHRGVEFFVEKVDIRPYNRVYTKFGRNKFRIFEKKQHDD